MLCFVMQCDKWQLEDYFESKIILISHKLHGGGGGLESVTVPLIEQCLMIFRWSRCCSAPSASPCVPEWPLEWPLVHFSLLIRTTISLKSKACGSRYFPWSTSVKPLVSSHVTMWRDSWCLLPLTLTPNINYAWSYGPADSSYTVSFPFILSILQHLDVWPFTEIVHPMIEGG